MFSVYAQCGVYLYMLKHLSHAVVFQVMLHDTVAGTKAAYTAAGLIVMLAGFLLPFETKGRGLEVGMDDSSYLCLIDP